MEETNFNQFLAAMNGAFVRSRKWHFFLVASELFHLSLPGIAL